MAETPLASPETSTGVERSVCVPSPSWRKELAPQHLAPPALVSAQVLLAPAAMAETPLASPETSTGVERLVSVPSPSWPQPLSPQHLPPPALVSAQLCKPEELMAMAVMPLSSPTTSTGVERLIVVPSPSWPQAFHPQHLTPPALVSAQVWGAEEASAEMALVSPAASTRGEGAVVVASTSGAEELEHEH